MVIDPIALLLAELEPVLRRHIRALGGDNIFGYWPLDLPHLLQTFGLWYIQRQLFGYLPDVLPDPDLHAALHRFWEERLTIDHYWLALIHSPWPSEFHPTDDPDSCGERDPMMTAAAYGVSSSWSSQVGLSHDPVRGFPDVDGGATGYSPQSPPATSTSSQQDWSSIGYSPTYSPSSPTYTPCVDNQLTTEDIDNIDHAIHACRTHNEVNSDQPAVIEIIPDEDEEFDSDYVDE